MNTTDGLDHVLAGGITLRDPVDEPEFGRDAHGSALDRVALRRSCWAASRGCSAWSTKCTVRADTALGPRRAGEGADNRYRR